MWSNDNISVDCCIYSIYISRHSKTPLMKQPREEIISNFIFLLHSGIICDASHGKLHTSYAAQLFKLIHSHSQTRGLSRLGGGRVIRRHRVRSVTSSPCRPPLHPSCTAFTRIATLGKRCLTRQPFDPIVVGNTCCPVSVLDMSNVARTIP